MTQQQPDWPQLEADVVLRIRLLAEFCIAVEVEE